VRIPDEGDWGKLKRLLRYIRSTIYMPLILPVDSLNITKWWVDVSSAKHDNCRGHTGAMMSLGRISIIGMSKKQKINTRSSTEAEPVGTNDAIPQMMWTRYFLEAQSFIVYESILNQDNMSTMLLETNGRQSSSKRTKHVCVRYFFIKDKVTSKEIALKHCPSHFTKPLQGALFRKLRAEIQGIPADMNEAELGWDRIVNSEESGESSPNPQECVGHSIKDPRVKYLGLRGKYLLAMQKRRTAGKLMAGAAVTIIARSVMQ
jgi:hypothetical protein